MRTFSGLFVLYVLGFGIAAMANCQSLIFSTQNDLSFLTQQYSSSEVQLDWQKFDSENAKFSRLAIERAKAASKIITRFSKHRKTAIYPASGFDLSTPFLLSPEITTVIGIDRNPFLMEWNRAIKINLKDEHKVQQEELADKLKNRSWIKVGDVAGARQMAPSLLAVLKLAFPEARIHSVTRLDNDSSSHGIIIFDTGPGTQIRQYIHLQERMDTLSTTLSPLENTIFDNLKPDVILFKAAMVVTGGFGTVHEDSLGFSMAKKIADNGGVIIDADGRHWPQFLSTQIPKILLTNFSLGYEEINLYEFAKPRK